ncbi:MAG: hypothetical protein IJZ29_02415 [Clostridia bacterium]|nr:hypothetical protein [Clostridia bacterium]
MALVGEGKYPEAVVPLGNSPQFASMKSEIANTVLSGLIALQKNNNANASTGEIILNIDGERLARLIMPKIDSENKRKGVAIQLREV